MERFWGIGVLFVPHGNVLLVFSHSPWTRVGGSEPNPLGLQSTRDFWPTGSIWPQRKLFSNPRSLHPGLETPETNPLLLGLDPVSTMTFIRITIKGYSSSQEFDWQPSLWCSAGRSGRFALANK